MKRQDQTKCRDCGENEIELYEWNSESDDRMYFYYRCDNCDKGAFTEYFAYVKTEIDN